ncbi:TIM barrel protein, AP endonuclease family 2/xylose isomerase-like family [Syntrophotalea carbinolica DSM 2380]|uniref:TIM barrel protein, AP endonuclease family 2/xylose isomerase-like family n=1 Tax=Syntrophotalea carbinolica (strain DSM 2380 / NBRC 103641 / GraBd1) TaxID=338963 RepID=Q3A6C7_SYNC1|nr:sugar phosphate isomerase/epimerase [Syntrophotalea carbinolica]ABA88080.1 TIM barrel protein, AP endonuclease family 2/xylose isomerase-like family [Syntrophotalea carbinolica DSM 2380]
MQPTIAMCNIFDQDAERLAAFADQNGFSAIDWSLDPSLPERELLSQIKVLDGFQVRYHCRFHGVDVAYSDQRGDDSLALLLRTVDQVAAAGGRYMTVHSGLGNPSGEGIDLNRAITNLTTLVEHGRRNGVAVALENLTTPLTNDPLVFRRIVTESDAYVTIDIGHAHAVRHLHPHKSIFDEYILPHRDRLLNAHVYHTELDGYGHVPPADLADISDRLDLLGLAESCDWWVIELMNPSELLHTRDLLQNYLEASSPQTVEVRQPSSFPLGAI